jgi:hypothetical protein
MDDFRGGAPGDQARGTADQHTSSADSLTRANIGRKAIELAAAMGFTPSADIKRGVVIACHAIGNPEELRGWLYIGIELACVCDGNGEPHLLEVCR